MDRDLYRRLEQQRARRREMDLPTFIEDVERSYFRTPYDTGGNRNAMFVWNIVREYAGLEPLDRDALIRRHADYDGVPFEEMKAQYDEYDAYRRQK